MDIAYTLMLSCLLGTVAWWTAAGMPHTRAALAAQISGVNNQRFCVIVMLANLAVGLYGLWLFGWGRELVGFLLLASYLIAITPEDIRAHTIPDRTTLLFLAAFLLYRLWGLDWLLVLDAALGAAAGLLLLGLPYLIRRSSVGPGDVKTVTVCGVMLGLVGVMYFILRAFVAMFVFTLVRLLLKKVTLKTEVAFAPFLLFAALI